MSRENLGRECGTGKENDIRKNNDRSLGRGILVKIIGAGIKTVRVYWGMWDLHLHLKCIKVSHYIDVVRAHSIDKNAGEPPCWPATADRA